MEELEKALHQDLMELSLKEICGFLKKKTNYTAIKQEYLKSHNRIITTKKVVKHVCNLDFSDEETLWLDRCLHAFFNKKPVRGTIPDVVRTELWEKQSGRCAICGKNISLGGGHVDHIIPWDFVGDELDDNFQLLCGPCNEHKSNNVGFNVYNLVFKKGIKRE